MSIIDRALEANRDYAKKYDPKLGGRPMPKIAVVTCMDPRLSDLPAILGLPQADIDVIRTGGPAVTDDVLNARLAASTGDSSPAPMRFFSFKDPEQNTLEQIEKVRSHPWIAKDVPVRGFVLDVETGLLTEIHPAAAHASA